MQTYFFRKYITKIINKRRLQAEEKGQMKHSLRAINNLHWIIIKIISNYNVDIINMVIT